ncbi:MAG TPA: STAS domain-containing protein [bacterium]|nr:STAS domain-containing protein [bacterium]
MKITEKKVADVVILQPEGRVDLAAIPEFSARLNRALRDGESKVLLDLSKTLYMSSSCLRSLLEAQKASMAEGKILVLCSPNEQLAELFDVVHIDKSFTIYNNDFEALDHLIP